IRANRSKPGLMRQHLTCVEAACAVCGGHAEGAELGSQALTFVPNEVQGGAYTFAIGTAGSTTLVLQTVLPALMTTAEPSSVSITGGTHNPYAPTVHFLQRAFVPLVHRMGPDIAVTLDRHGFFPAGGGQIRVEIRPAARLQPIEIDTGGPFTRRRAIATVAGLAESIGRRELSVVRDRLGFTEDEIELHMLDDAIGPGNILGIEIERETITEVFTGFGQRGTSAETVAKRAAGDAMAYLNAGVPVWRHLADQLMLPLALAGGGGFRTGPLTDHATTNATVIETFLDVRVHTSVEEDGTTLVRVHA
ncbi:MAG: RNA 3'-terminal phosphate cyclase, partial [Planctomycetota bacterium]